MRRSSGRPKRPAEQRYHLITILNEHATHINKIQIRSIVCELSGIHPPQVNASCKNSLMCNLLDFLAMMHAHAEIDRVIAYLGCGSQIRVQVETIFDELKQQQTALFRFTQLGALPFGQLLLHAVRQVE
jgi:hypothetical protein